MEETPPGLVRDFLSRVARAPARALLLDYDGTLAPFTADRDRAFPYAAARDAVARIARADPSGRSRLGVVSGRPLRDLPHLLGVEAPIELWGSHGLERLSAEGTYSAAPPAPAVAQLQREVQAWIAARRLADLFEPKPYGFALHARGTAPERYAEGRDALLARFAPAARREGLEILAFDGGFELRPAGRHKGEVVETVAEEVGPRGAIAYLGDDRTDEDAFAALAGRGLAVLVRERRRPSAAPVWIRPPEELVAFLADWERAIRAGADLASSSEGAP